MTKDDDADFEIGELSIFYPAFGRVLSVDRLSKNRQRIL